MESAKNASPSVFLNNTSSFIIFLKFFLFSYLRVIRKHRGKKFEFSAGEARSKTEYVIVESKKKLLFPNTKNFFKIEPLGNSKKQWKRTLLIDANMSCFCWRKKYPEHSILVCKA